MYGVPVCFSGALWLKGCVVVLWCAVLVFGLSWNMRIYIMCFSMCVCCGVDKRYSLLCCDVGLVCVVILLCGVCSSITKRHVVYCGDEE